MRLGTHFNIYYKRGLPEYFGRGSIFGMSMLHFPG